MQRFRHLQYQDGRLDFESARTKLHALPPESTCEVFARATAARIGRRDMLVMVLADVGYPPALPAMRQWLDDADTDGIASPAASALDELADKRFDVARCWRPVNTTVEVPIGPLIAPARV